MLPGSINYFLLAKLVCVIKSRLLSKREWMCLSNMTDLDRFWRQALHSLNHQIIIPSLLLHLPTYNFCALELFLNYILGSWLCDWYLSILSTLHTLFIICSSLSNNGCIDENDDLARWLLEMQFLRLACLQRYVSSAHRKCIPFYKRHVAAWWRTS